MTNLAKSSPEVAPAGAAPRPFSIFLCHAREDESDVEYFHALLSRYGVDARYDKRQPSGQRLDVALLEDIEQSIGFAIFISKHFLAKYYLPKSPDRPKGNWIQREVSYALEHNKRLFVIQLDKAAAVPKEIHETWTRMEYFGDEFKKAKQKFQLLKSIGIPTRALVEIYGEALEQKLLTTDSYKKLKQECVTQLAAHHQLVLLSSQGGYASALARDIADRYYGNVTVLSPTEDPAVLSPHEEQANAIYCMSLLRKGTKGIDSFPRLLEYLKKRATLRRGAHLIYVEHDRGSLQHLKTLGRYLHELQSELSGRAVVHVLVDGGAAASSLMLRRDGGSVFQPSATRVISDLTMTDVKMLIDSSALSLEPLFNVTGGHLQLLAEALAYADGDKFRLLETSQLLNFYAESEWIQKAAQNVLKAPSEDTPPYSWDMDFALDILLLNKPLSSASSLGYDCNHPEVCLFFAGLTMTQNASHSAVLRPAAHQVIQRLRSKVA